MEVYRLGIGRVLELLLSYGLLLATRAMVFTEGLQCAVTSAPGGCPGHEDLPIGSSLSGRGGRTYSHVD